VLGVSPTHIPAGQTVYSGMSIHRIPAGQQVARISSASSRVIFKLNRRGQPDPHRCLQFRLDCVRSAAAMSAARPAQVFQFFAGLHQIGAVPMGASRLSGQNTVVELYSCGCIGGASHPGRENTNAARVGHPRFHTDKRNALSDATLCGRGIVVD
jgi:hypothetical protein